MVKTYKYTNVLKINSELTLRPLLDTNLSARYIILEVFYSSTRIVYIVDMFNVRSIECLQSFYDKYKKYIQTC